MSNSTDEAHKSWQACSLDELNARLEESLRALSLEDMLSVRIVARTEQGVAVEGYGHHVRVQLSWAQLESLLAGESPTNDELPGGTIYPDLGFAVESYAEFHLNRWFADHEGNPAWFSFSFGDVKVDIGAGSHLWYLLSGACRAWWFKEGHRISHATSWVATQPNPSEVLAISPIIPAVQSNPDSPGRCSEDGRIECDHQGPRD